MPQQVGPCRSTSPRTSALHRTARPAARRTSAVIVAAVLGLSLAACSSSNAKPGTFASQLPAPTQLTQAEFVTQMNNFCSAVNSQRKQLPTPTSLTDYSAVIANLNGTLALLPSFINRAQQLIDRTANKAELMTNWLSIEKADFAGIKPIAEKMVADSKAKNQTKVAADASALQAAPDHSQQIAAFMSSYGLDNCATLESG